MQRLNQGLVDVLVAFSSDVEHHKSVFLRALGNRAKSTSIDLDVQHFAGWYGLIGLHDAWSRFCKSAVLVSFRGDVVTQSGVLVPPSPAAPSIADPIQFLRKNWPKGYGGCGHDGPSWHIPAFSNKAAQILQIANFNTFSGAILAKADAPTELTACRNYLVHRHLGTESNDSVQALRDRIGVTPKEATTDNLAEQIVSSGITLFEEWCIELVDIAKIAIS